jgi:hypothetical protein
MGMAMAVLTAPGLLHAQIRPEPGVVIDGKVAVRVYVTLRDDETPYYPVSQLELRFYRNAKDSIVATTDDAGSVTLLLPAGEYRLVSARDVRWKGKIYSWSIPLTVRPNMPAIDLREAATTPNATRVVLQDRTPVTAEAANGTVALGVSGSVADRSGFWMNLGLGVGSLICDGCDGRQTGWGGSLAFGGTLNRRLLLGIFSNVVSKTSDRFAVTAGTFTPGLRVYPSASAGFFLATGLGLSSLITDVSDIGATIETGAGGLLGLGWDLKIGTSTSITLFWNASWMYINNATWNFGQLGLGITWN